MIERGVGMKPEEFVKRITQEISGLPAPLVTAKLINVIAYLAQVIYERLGEKDLNDVMVDIMDVIFGEEYYVDDEDDPCLEDPDSADCESWSEDIPVYESPEYYVDDKEYLKG